MRNFKEENKFLAKLYDSVDFYKPEIPTYAYSDLDYDADDMPLAGDELDTNSLSIVDADYFDDIDHAENLQMIKCTDENNNYNGFLDDGRMPCSDDFYFIR